MLGLQEPRIKSQEPRVKNQDIKGQELRFKISRTGNRDQQQDTQDRGDKEQGVKSREIRAGCRIRNHQP